MIASVSVCLKTLAPAETLTALADAVHSLKGDSPLAPVIVIVPTNATGVIARRFLGRHGGIAAVEMVTIQGLAEFVAGPGLASQGRSPVSTPVLDMAICDALDDQPGVFAQVREHESTIVAIRDLHIELRRAGQAAADVLASSSERGRHAVAISNLASKHLPKKWYDDRDLLLRAIQIVRDDMPKILERVVVFLPHPLRGLDAQLVAALAENTEVTLIIPITGSPAVDDEMLETAYSLGAPRPSEPHQDPPLSTPGNVTIFSTSDAGEEVRHAVRAIVEAAREGIAFARMTLLWPSGDPYARLVEHHLDLANIPWNGRPGTAASERTVPRFLLDLLNIDRRRLRRSDVFEFLADVPSHDSAGRLIAVARWESVSRAAGVTDDATWAPRLRAFASREREHAGKAGRPTSSRADDAEALGAFIIELRRSLGSIDDARTWKHWVDWAEGEIEQRLGRRFLSTLAEPERLAFEHTKLVLDRLRALHTAGLTVYRKEFQSTFAAEFDAAPGRVGKIGSGVSIGALSAAIGIDVDLAIILGAHEGLMPSAPNPGPLVSDLDRRNAGLAPADATALRLERQFHCVLASAGRTIVLFPRGDMLSASVFRPSRWLQVAAPAGIPAEIGSYHSALLAHPFPATPTEHRLRGLLAAVTTTGGAALEQAAGHDPALARALAMRAARRSDLITEFDGDLSSCTIEHFDDPIAPTRLETFVGCPHAYFVRYMLETRPVEDPGDEIEMTGLDNGNLVHEVLDRFHRDVITGSLAQPDANGWGAAHNARLDQLFNEVANEFEANGHAGLPATWIVRRDELLSELLEWLASDSRYIEARGSTVIASEFSFGGKDDPVALELSDGTSIQVTGKIDRIDRTSAGGLVVTDHKSGDSKSFKKIKDDPTADGTKFQLATYAAAAAARFQGATSVVSEYAFLKKGKFARIGAKFDESKWEQVAAGLTHVVAGMGAGLFPAHPDEEPKPRWVPCRYCDPDGLGTVDLLAQWKRKSQDQRWVALMPEADASDAVDDDDGEAS